MSTSTATPAENATLPVRNYQIPFWPRQICEQPTREQYAFDMLFGVCMPLVCLYLDPIVFRSNLGPPLLRGASLAVYSFMLVCMLALVLWLTIRWPPALLSGVLVGGALFAACLGIVLFPFSLMGLFVLIGAFGFTPLATAFVYGRNALRAYHRSQRAGKSVRSGLLAIAALMMCLALPLAVHFTGGRLVENAMADALSDDIRRSQNGLAVLKRLHHVTGLDPIVWQFARSTNPDERKRLANIYHELTGEGIEWRLNILLD